MARASLAQLIARVRFLIVDPAGASQQFADDDIADTLDLRRQEMRFVPLRPMPTFQPGATVVFLDYYADTENWEADVQLQDTSFNTLTPSLSELLVGHWSFTTQPNGLGVRATGKVFDLYGAAADLCDVWAQALYDQFDFASDRQSFKVSQKFQNKLALAAKYRALAWPSSNRIVQADANADTDGGGVVYPDHAVETW